MACSLWLPLPFNRPTEKKIEQILTMNRRINAIVRRSRRYIILVCYVDTDKSHKGALHGYTCVR